MTPRRFRYFSGFAVRANAARPGSVVVIDRLPLIDLNKGEPARIVPNDDVISFKQLRFYKIEIDRQNLSVQANNAHYRLAFRFGKMHFQ